MDDEGLKAIGNIIDKKFGEKLSPLKTDLGKVKSDLVEIKETVNANNVSLIKLENTIGVYKDALDVERKRIDRHDGRLEVIEKVWS
ncbi:MAG TPA: hypothetical protein VF303_03440 [Candidatus Nanoarchaeia archaeon]